ncbi:hypothetical protein ACIBVO_34430, partial [Streptomyces tendae]
MNIVHARLWQTKVSIGSDGLAEVVTATEVGRGPLPVSLSQLVGINALACDLRGVIDEGVHDHEVNLLTKGCPVIDLRVASDLAGALVLRSVSASWVAPT